MYGGGTIRADATRSASVVFGMADDADWGGRQRWEGSGASGTGNFDDLVVETGRTQTWTGSGKLTQLDELTAYAKMDIDPAGCKYSVEFHPYLLVIYTDYGHEESRGIGAWGHLICSSCPCRMPPGGCSRVRSICRQQ